MVSHSDSLPKTPVSAVKPGKSSLDRLPVELWEKRSFGTHRRLKWGVNTLKKTVVYPCLKGEVCGGCLFSF